MRVISGKYRGTIIPSPKEEIVKPTLDRIKENIFNILQFKIKDSVCLDLFCGSGALGLECLSRGAKEVYFVDNNKNNILMLQKLLIKLKAENFEAIISDFYESLSKFEKLSKKFDVIFLDPPYDSDLAQIALQKILKMKLLNENGVIIWEHQINVDTSKFAHKIKNSRVYGKIQVDFIF